MTKHCINHARVTWDCCRRCNGKDIECPEYLSDIEHTRQDKTSVSHNHADAEVHKASRDDRDKTAETYSNATYNAEVDDTLYTWETKHVERDGEKESTRVPKIVASDNAPETYSRPFFWFHNYLNNDYVVNKVNPRNFIERFRRYQR